jgi:hypothetical protein
MDIQSLKTYAEKSDVRNRILAGYTGDFALGVARAPEGGEGFVFLLRVDTADLNRFPPSINLDDEWVPVVVRPGYKAPHFQLA